MVRGCRSSIAAVLAVAAVFAAGAAPASAASESDYADPLRALGAVSPACADHDIGTQARRNCESSGAVAHRYPISSYGIDVQVGFSIAHMDRSFLGALQSIAALLWMA